MKHLQDLTKEEMNYLLQTSEDEYLDILKFADLSNKYDLEEVMRKYPAYKARYIFALEKQNTKVLKLEQDLKVLYYELYKEYKLTKKENLTEEGVKAKIYTDTRYIELQNKLLEEKKILAILRGIKEVLDDVGRMVYALTNLSQLQNKI